MESSIAGRLLQIEEKIEAACIRSGRKRREISLMGVTKFHPVETVEAARQAGIRLFGESRVREGREKFSRFFENHPRGESGVELHLIGSLQRNKAKDAAAFFDCIQSVDRDSLIEVLGNLTSEDKGLRKKPLDILLEYHTGEETKAGFPSMDALFRAAERVLSFPGLKPAGLMTMAPFTLNSSEVRLAFRKLAEAQAELEKRFPLKNGGWRVLSMGMTTDFEVAIEEGSTLIRIGTALFGERAP